MRILLFCALLQSVYADPGLLFKSYLGKSALCKPWTCVQNEFGLDDSLPPRHQVTEILKQLLPKDDWQNAIAPTLDACYGNPPRIYTNTCPGQALWHCVIDNLNENCPEQSVITDDACAPVNSLAGLKYMFSQSRYQNFIKNSEIDKRPVCYLKNYFHSKCCFLPTIFSNLLLNECKFSSMLRIYIQGPEKRGDVSSDYLGFINRTHTKFHHQRPKDEQLQARDQTTSYQCSASLFQFRIKAKTESSESTTEKITSQITEYTTKNENQETQKDPDITETTLEGTTEEIQKIKDYRAPETSPTKEISLATLFNTYLGASQLCKPWSCLRSKLGLGELPTKDAIAVLLNALLPDEPWNSVITKTLDICFDDPPRRYTNTCPGQAMWHCLIDNFSENCPEERLIKEDACAPIGSLAGLNYMFSQSRYTNFAKRLAVDKRPVWFLRNYFSSKCCRLPSIFNRSLLKECDFSTMITTYLQTPTKHKDGYTYSRLRIQNETSIYHTENEAQEEISDPVDCCDLSDFMPDESRNACDFKMSWDTVHRLNIQEDPELLSTTSDAPDSKEINYDVTVVPLSCEEETCVFRKLNVVKKNGRVNVDIFLKLLDNMTVTHPEWKKAKAKVFTKCLTRPLNLYEADCEINKLLACTFDVLSENCPHAKGKDPCKNLQDKDNNMMCQVSSSLYRPKRRRQYCGFPSFVSHKILSRCRINSISDMKFVPVSHSPSNVSEYGLYKQTCKELSSTTQCVLKKLGILNKYGFMDYFKMKGLVRLLSLDEAWSPHLELYESALLDLPLYGAHCNSPRRFLNVLDVMLSTCPLSKRRSGRICDRIFNEMKSTSPYRPKSDEDLYPLLKLFEPEMPLIVKPRYPRTTPKVIVNPPFDFGILNSKAAPPVKIIDLKPETNPSGDTPLLSPNSHSDPTLRGFRLPFESPKIP